MRGCLGLCVMSVRSDAANPVSLGGACGSTEGHGLPVGSEVLGLSSSQVRRQGTPRPFSDAV